MSLSPLPFIDYKKRENHVFDKNTQIKRKFNFITQCLLVLLCICFLPSQCIILAKEWLMNPFRVALTRQNPSPISDKSALAEGIKWTTLGFSLPLMADRISHSTTPFSLLVTLQFSVCVAESCCYWVRRLSIAVPSPQLNILSHGMVTRWGMLLSASHPELSMESGYVLAILFSVSFRARVSHTTPNELGNRGGGCVAIDMLFFSRKYESRSEEQ